MTATAPPEGGRMDQASTRTGEASPAGGAPDDLAELMRRVSEQGDEAAYAELFRSIAPLVKAYMMRGGADAATAEELAQETLTRVWTKAALYDPRKGGARSWILSVARNLRIDRVRRERVWTLSQPLPDGYAEQASDDPPADERLDDRMRDARVREALDALPPEQRAVIVMCFIDGLSQSDIARRLGVPLGTIKSRTRLAYAKMRPLLTGGAPGG